MDIVLIVLRFVHIVAAFAWVGIGVTTTFFIAPAAAAAGESGLRFMKSLFTRTSLPMIFPAASGLTTLAGLLLYLVGNATSHFSTTGNIVLGIGAVAGLLATIHGGAVTGRSTRAMVESLTQHVPDGNQPISAEGLAALRERGQDLGSHTRVSLALMLIALVGMASARYL
jgi:hypothetical protein